LPHVVSPDEDRHYPGERRGLPPDGPGSVAGWGRRIAALVIDWVLSMLVTAALLGQAVFSLDNASRVGLARLLVFAVEIWILTALLGGSAGQLLVGVSVRRTSGAPLDPARVLLRTVLICLLIPPVIYNRDRQGLHDLAVDSITLRR
jgi:RDD family protein